MARALPVSCSTKATHKEASIAVAMSAFPNRAPAYIIIHPNAASMAERAVLLILFKRRVPPYALNSTILNRRRSIRTSSLHKLKRCRHRRQSILLRPEPAARSNSGN